MSSNPLADKPSIIPVDTHLSDPTRPSALARLGRKLMFGQFALLRDGELRVVDHQGESRFGQRTPRLDLSVTITVDHPQLYADAAFGGTVGAGEAYIRGLWRCDDLTGLVRLFVANRDMMNGMDSRWSLISRPFLRLFHVLNRNSRQGSARNIAAHYDLGNELYRLMLDPTMAYSCGIFERADSTLEQASIAKFDAVCRKLALSPSDHLVEIGTGWGGLAIHAARHYGCQVTTTTISQEQHDWAREQIARAGLSDRITLLLDDYRDLTGRYDKLVSIEMIEAVGHRWFDTYFRTCSRLLAPDGQMLLQAITIRDQEYARTKRSVDFIQRHVFPGGCLPSVQALADTVARVTDLRALHLEDIGPHYATTLRHWRERFLANLDRVRALGFDDTFLRLWEYYLAYCEGGFAERYLGTVQLLLAKPECRRAVLPS